MAAVNPDVFTVLGSMKEALLCGSCVRNIVPGRQLYSIWRGNFLQEMIVILWVKFYTFGYRLVY